MDGQRDVDCVNFANSSLPTEAHVERVESGLYLSHRECTGFTIVRFILGVLLLTTAGLKLFDPSPDVFRGLEPFSSPQGRMAVIEVEAILGLWLLAGAQLRLLWVSALLFFVILASASLYMGIEGQSSCGCFGAKLSVSPWYAFGLDLAAVASLLCWRPRQEYRSDAAMMRRTVAVAAGAGVILAAVMGVLTWVYGSPYEALLYAKGESLTVEPSVSHVGDGVAGERRTFTIQLTNHRDNPIKVIGGTTNCSCIATSDLPIVVPPKESRSITVRINFRGGPGRFRHSFVLYTDDERQATITAWFSGRMIESPSP